MADNELVKREQNLPVVDFGEDAGDGFQDTTPDELQIPFLAILQDGSPQVTGADGKELKGAKSGLLMNTVTDELSSEILFVPSIREKCFVEWKSRDAGGGFIACHDRKSDFVLREREKSGKKFGKMVLENGNELMETVYLYGIQTDEDGCPVQPLVIAFTSTKLGIFRKWFSKVNRLMIPTPNGGKKNPPMYSHRLRISTFRDKNPKGIFFNFVIKSAIGEDMAQSLILDQSDPCYMAGKELKGAVEKGLGKPVYESANVGAEEVVHEEF